MTTPDKIPQAERVSLFQQKPEKPQTSAQHHYQKTSKLRGISRFLADVMEIMPHTELQHTLNIYIYLYIDIDVMLYMLYIFISSHTICKPLFNRESPKSVYIFS